MPTARGLIFALIPILVLGGCRWMSKGNGPLDIDENAPLVSEVIGQVQAAIDATAANPAWTNTQAYADALRACTDDADSANSSWQSHCDAHYAAARNICATLAGATAGPLCADHLREAGVRCGAPPPRPDACADAESLAPVRITRAKFQFVAAASQKVGGGANLRLISFQAARAAGRTASYEIEMVPQPTGAPDMKSFRNGEEPPLSRNLRDVLFTALNAANPCERDRTDSAQCPKGAAPNLILKGATYAVEINYIVKSGVAAEWTVSPLKLSDGTFEAGHENTIGNVLTLEISR